LSGIIKGPVLGGVMAFAGRLRFPYLFGVTLVVFVVDLFVPDLVPFADEIFLGLLTVLFGAWRKRRKGPGQAT
jgi:hypothetical protein